MHIPHHHSSPDENQHQQCGFFLSFRLSLQQQCNVFISMWKDSVKWTGKTGCSSYHTHGNMCLIKSSDPPKSKLKYPPHTHKTRLKKPTYRDVYLRKELLLSRPFSKLDGGQRRVQMRIKCIRSEKHLIHLYIHSTKFQLFIKNRLKWAKPNQVRVFHKSA